MHVEIDHLQTNTVATYQIKQKQLWSKRVKLSAARFNITASIWSKK